MLLGLKHHFIGLTVLVAICRITTAQTGVVEGVVEDKLGTLIRNAKVTLTPPGSPGGAFEHWAKADNEGRFVFNKVRPGKYFIYAVKEEDGFPNVVFSFFDIGQPRPQEIDVGETTISVVIDVGEPEGRLNCRVQDNTGKPLQPAGYKLMAADDPEINLISGGRLDGRIETLVPGVPIILEIEAPGFQTWRSDRITVKTGQVKELTIKLTPVLRAK